MREILELSIATARIIKLIKLFGLRAKLGLQAGPAAALFLFLFSWRGCKGPRELFELFELLGLRG